MNIDNERKPHPKLWHSRGYLPHFDGGEIVQFVTFRLGDSLPRNTVEKWRMQLEQDLISEIEYHRKMDKYLDRSFGECWLRDRRIAEMIEETLFHFDGDKYRSIAYVLMPNHVHILIKPKKNSSLASIMHSIKSYTSHEANRLLQRKGEFWNKEYFDRFMRDYEHYIKTIDYIHNNPVRAKLCRNFTEWRFSSAFREIT